MNTTRAWDEADQQEVGLAKANLITILDAADAAKKMAAFYDPTRNYAGATFHLLAPLPKSAAQDDITAADLLAVTLMDVTVHPVAVRRLLDPGEPRQTVITALRQVPLDLDLAAAPDDRLDAAAEFYERVKETLRGNKWVTASKLAARKRPALIPVRDSVVVEQLGLSNRDFRRDWSVFRALVRDEEVTERVEAVARQAAEDTAADLAGLPLLRLIDTAVWMHPRQLAHRSSEAEPHE